MSLSIKSLTFHMKNFLTANNLPNYHEEKLSCQEMLTNFLNHLIFWVVTKVLMLNLGVVIFRQEMSGVVVSRQEMSDVLESHQEMLEFLEILIPLSDFLMQTKVGLQSSQQELVGVEILSFWEMSTISGLLSVQERLTGTVMSIWWERSSILDWHTWILIEILQNLNRISFCKTLKIGIT